jgi:MobA/VirD2-like, nuclease domain
VINKCPEKMGHDIAGLVRYLFGKGNSNEHTRQRVIAADEQLEVADGTLLNKPEDRARIAELGFRLDSHRRLMAIAPEKGWVYHLAISLKPGEFLSDEQWAQVARETVDALGFTEKSGKSPCRWIAVHHGQTVKKAEHIHIAVNLVREDGTLATRGWDKRTMSRLCAEWERRYGLHVVEGRTGRGLPGYTRAESERAQRRSPVVPESPNPGNHDQRPETDREVAARRVRAAAACSRSEAEFVRRMRAGGLAVRPRYGKGDTASVIGYSVGLREVPDGGKQIFYGGGRPAADLSLPALRASRWGSASTAQTSPDALAEWNRARVDRPARRVAGDEESRIESWTAAAEAVQAVSARLRDIPADRPVVWAYAADQCAGLLSVLADVHPDAGMRRELARAARGLAWSAQQARHQERRQEDRAYVRGFTELADVARFISVAARRQDAGAGGEFAVALVLVVIAVLLLIKLMQEIHRAAEQAHQAALLDQRREGLTWTVEPYAPPIPHWQDRSIRPHGWRSGSGLADYRVRIAERTSHLTAAEHGAAAGLAHAQAGNGPQAAQLLQTRDTRLEELRTAATAECELPAAGQAVQAARTRAIGADVRVSSLEYELSQTSRTRLLRTSKIERQLQAARAELQAARAGLAAAQQTYDQLHAAATAPYGRHPNGSTTWTMGRAEADRRALDQDWPATLQAAIARDVDGAQARTQQLEVGRAIAASFRPDDPHTAAEGHQVLAAVDVEQGLRARMTPDHDAVEKTARAASAQAARARQATSPATSRTPSWWRKPPGPSKGHGPSL